MFTGSASATALSSRKERLFAKVELCRNGKCYCEWAEGLATIRSHSIYHLLRPYAADLKMSYPARLNALAASKRKTDCLDARTPADLLRCDLFPECCVLAPAYAQLRQQLRYR
jgi:transposase